jgi:hypothetical protein
MAVPSFRFMHHSHTMTWTLIVMNIQILLVSLHFKDSFSRMSHSPSFGIPLKPETTEEFISKGELCIIL